MKDWLKYLLAYSIFFIFDTLLTFIVIFSAISIIVWFVVYFVESGLFTGFMDHTAEWFGDRYQVFKQASER